MFRDKILNKAFEQLVGRIPPEAPYCESVTIGANLGTMNTYAEKCKLELSKIDEQYREQMEVQVYSFMGLMKNLSKPEEM